MAPPARPTKKAPAAKLGPKPKAAKPEAAEAATAAPKRTRNQRPKMPVFYEDTEDGTLLDLGTYIGANAEDALSSYLKALDSDEEREQAIAAADYAVFTPDEGIVRISIVPPTEPTFARR